jgi:two-component system LytT family response regulator
MKIRTLIVDDEPPAREKLRTLLAAENDIELCGEAGNGDDAIRLIGELRPDLLFLDVQMPAPDGLAVLRAVRDEWLPCTVFTTAHAEHAVEAFALHALDYLLKPFSRARFAAALDRARHELARRDGRADERVGALLRDPAVGTTPTERFLVKTNERYCVVRSGEIEWVEAAANYVVLHTSQGNHILRRTLAGLEAELDPARFFRVSRSALVQLDRVRAIEAVRAGEHVLSLESGARVAMTCGLRDLQQRLQGPARK